jgi:glycerol kinase
MFLGIDQGTTGTTVIAFDKNLKAVAQAYRRIESIHPQTGWVEQNPEAIIGSVVEAVADVLVKIGGVKNIQAAGLTNQGESVLAWDTRAGQAITPVMVWSDRRASSIANDLKPFEKRVRKLTGLELSDYFCASKYAWLLKNNPDVQHAAKQGTLRLGTLDSWMAFKLGGLHHVSDHSTASRTQLLGLNSGQWEKELLELFQIPLEVLAEVKPSLGNWGYLRHSSWQGEIPWFASLVDQAAALAGNGCLKAGDIKITYGTGCFVYINAGNTIPQPDKSLLASVAWTNQTERTYALDGGVFTAGTAINWLVDLGLAESPEQTAALAQSSTNQEVRFLPAFTGLGAPWWDSEVRGIFSGISAGTSKADLTRAVLDSVAYRVTDIVRAMWLHHPKSDVIRVDGGLTKNPYLMQLQANLLGVAIAVSAQTEATALGAALLAGTTAKLLNIEDIQFGSSRIFEPQWSTIERETRYEEWLVWLEKARRL